MELNHNNELLFATFELRKILNELYLDWHYFNIVQDLLLALKYRCLVLQRKKKK